MSLRNNNTTKKQRAKSTSHKGMNGSSNMPTYSNVRGQIALQSIPKTIDLIFPDKMQTRLRFFGVGRFSVTTPSSHFGARYRPSYAYDLDPQVGGASAAGFTVLATIYNRYRVRASSMKLQISNEYAAQAASIVVLPTVEDFGASPSVTTVANWFSNPYATYKTVGTAGSPAVTISNEMTSAKIFGTRSALVDDDYASLVNTGPIINWYWNIGVLTDAAPASTLNLYAEISIDIDVEFFNRIRQF